MSRLVMARPEGAASPVWALQGRFVRPIIG